MPIFKPVKNIRKFLSYPWLPVLLVPLFFVVHAWQRYVHYLNPSVPLRVWGRYLLFSAALFLLSRLLLRSWKNAGLATALLLSFFFLWGYLHDNLARLTGSALLVKVTVLVPLFLLLTGVLLWRFSRGSDAARDRVLYFVNLLFLAYTLIDLGLLGKALLQEPGHATKRHYSAEQLQLRATPDVYLLLFDEFPSTASLQENLHFDNRDIDTFLRQQGFSIQAQSRSNYNLTVFSMASMFNQSYLGFVKDPLKIDEEDFNRALKQLQQTDAVDRLQAAGYEFRNFSIFDMAQQQTLLTSNIFPEKARLITANTFYDKVLEAYVHMAKGPDTTRLWGMEGYGSVLDYNRNVKKKYLEWLPSQGNKPRFTYLHIVLPHDPFYYDSTGRVLDMGLARKVTRQGKTEYYLNNLKVARQWLRELVAATMQHTQGKAIVLVMGDHGHKKKVHAADDRIVFANLNAVYFPGEDYHALYDSISNLNLMRVVMNRIFVQQQALLKDSSVYLQQGY